MDDNPLHGTVYGFGFVPRAEVSQLADALRAASNPTRTLLRRRSYASRPAGAN